MPNPFIIEGRVLQADQRVVEKATIRVFDKDLPSLERRGVGPQELGRADITSDGYFEIRYTLDQFQDGEAVKQKFRRAAKVGADLVFRVFAINGQELKILRLFANDVEIDPSQILFNAPVHTTILIVVEPIEYIAPSENERVLAKVTPVLEGLPLQTLQKDDVAFLNGETGIDIQWIEFLQQAAHLGQETDLPSESFYGIARMGYLLDLATLGAMSADDLRYALTAAIDQRIISGKLQERVEEIVQRIRKFNHIRSQINAQLLDAGNGTPLVGYLLQVTDLEDDLAQVDVEKTDGQGMFAVLYFAPPAETGVAERRFRMTILGWDGTQVFQTETSLKIGQPDGVSIRIPMPSTNRPPPTSVRDITAILKAEIPSALQKFLRSQKIQTLADIRDAGGLDQLPGLPVAPNHPVVRMLQAHADLNRLSPDIALNSLLIAKNFSSVAAIARAPSSDFVSAVHSTVGDFHAAQMHVTARAQTAFLDNVLVGMAAAAANGVDLEIPFRGTSDFFSRRCACEDCQAAVSPAAYLADLLNYTLQHLQDNGLGIDVKFLENNFNQPFGDLPLSCAAVEQQVHQVRICIEILRIFLKLNPPANPQQDVLDGLQKTYLDAAYSELLQQLGTSYDDIRLGRISRGANRRLTANDLGIDLSEPRAPGDELDQLFLDSAALPGSPLEITEVALERLFGLADTARPPLSGGAKLGDDAISPQIKEWNLTGAQWGRNTGQDGQVFVSLTSPTVGSVFQIDVYRNALRTELVATGQSSSSQGNVGVWESNSSGLSGDFIIDYTTDNTSIEISAIPRFLTWRLRHLRAVWAQEDRPDDVYRAGRTFSELPLLPAGLIIPAGFANRLLYDVRNQELRLDGVMDSAAQLQLLTLSADPQWHEAIEILFEDSQRPPMIDPDIIGPDDFRVPTAKQPGGPDKAFDLWLKRRIQVDQIYAHLKTDRETTGSVLGQVFGLPLPDLDSLLADLTQGINLDQTKRRIKKLHLTPESLSRLVGIRAKDRLAANDPRTEKVTDAEWNEVYSILTQAEKGALFPAWRQEEDAASVLLGAQEFWYSLREPAVGDWPPIPQPGVPSIDPDAVKRTDLPEGIEGKQAVQLFQARTLVLSQIAQQLKVTRESSGFSAMLRFALGKPHSGDPLPDDPAKLRNDLASSDANIVTVAAKKITTDFHLSVDAFLRMMAVRAMDSDPNPLNKPTVADLAEVYTLLAPAHKVAHLYPVWISEEKAAGLDTSYWQALKAKLPIWRASPEARQLWRQALGSRSKAPIIDPDLIDPMDLKDSVSGDAFDLWNTRNAWINDPVIGQLSRLKKIRETSATPLAGFDAIVGATVGTKVDLLALRDFRDSGNSIESLLDQQSLTNSAFVYLLRIRNLAEKNLPILDTEWGEINSILLQVEKTRLFALWQEEERSKAIIKSPDFFVIPESPAITFPPAPPRSLAEWRVTRNMRLDWQDLLQSRIDQESGVIAGVQTAVSTVEENQLPALRDALVMATSSGFADLSARAKWVTRRLFVDAQMGGCQMTTRVAQAIETLQGLLFAARTVQISITGLSLVLNADDFDEEWKWIGSYATWRAAMFVFLYPENILLPSLRRHQSPLFGTIVDNLRSNPNLTPEKACEIACEYSKYFQDVSTLTLDASCQADTLTRAGAACNQEGLERKSLLYVFARGGVSNKVYWSSYDPADTTSYPQTLWAREAAFDDATHILGAVPYDLSPTSRFIFVFFETSDHKMKFTKYDLEKQVWTGDISELNLPPEESRFRILVAQSFDATDSPLLAIEGSAHLYLRKLDANGDDWDAGDWPAFIPNSWLRDRRGLLSVLRSPSYIEIHYRGSDGKRVIVSLTGSIYAENSGNVGVSQPLGPPLIDSFLGALWIDRDSIYFSRSPSGVSAISRNLPATAVTCSPSFLAGLKAVPPNYGPGPIANGVQRSVFAHDRIPIFTRGGSESSFLREGNYATTATYVPGDRSMLSMDSRPIAPRTDDQRCFTIPSRLNDDSRSLRTVLIRLNGLHNSDQSQSNLIYREEAYYFLPIHLALQLQRSGEYVAALDWFRTVYDYTAPLAERKIYDGLVSEESFSTGYARASNWLLDPLDPHAIAGSRRNTYTRFTIESIIRCLLDYADSEFTQDSPESLPLARQLYQTALDLLETNVLQQQIKGCADVIGALYIQIVEQLGAPAAVQVTRALSRIRDFAVLSNAADQVKGVLRRAGSQADRVARALSVVRAPGLLSPIERIGDVIGESKVAKRYATLLSNAEVNNASHQSGLAMAGRFLNGVASATGISAASLLNDRIDLPWLREPRLSNTSQTAVDHSQDFGILPFTIITTDRFCIPSNPILKALRTHAELDLFKLHTCRNIAGVKRELDPYAAPTDRVSGLPSIGAGGQLVLPGTAVIQPTLYHYSVLIERAKQLVQLAAQIENAMLDSLEARDAAAYTILQARQQLGLAQAGVELQSLRVTQAKDGVSLATLQQARSQIQADYYQRLLTTDLIQLEKDSVDALADAVNFLNDLSSGSFVAGGLELAAGVVAAVATAGAAGQLFQQGLQSIAAGMSTKAAALSTKASQLAAQASYERRRQDWQFQETLAKQDVVIGAQQITIANDQVQVVGQERAIAELQKSQADDSIRFLASKFTNVDLFDWMSNVLGGVYSWFLRHATATAKLAENQLAFERQESPVQYIQGDYWQAADNSGVAGNSLDRRGLTGSARLLQDISQLDQYAFETDKRKLQLTKTVSLAALAPAEFQRFRETGVLVFATTMETFDRDFPGHYLRLIKKIRTSVIALVPPMQGIRASLTAAAVSRVVIGGDLFQTVPVRRDPEFLALSSPMNATGLFDLDPQSDMLLPFEGRGVDTTWEFRMPKASNLFDYGTIGDVVITMDYTALNSFDYYQQVIQSLRPTLSAERPFNFRNEFADQWYDLNNPDQATPPPMTVRFTTAREDFPSNLKAFKIQQVVLYFSRADGSSFEVPVSSLHFTEQNGAGSVGGAATSIDGMVSTRRGNAGSWTGMIGKTPFGDWDLALPNSDEMKKRFINGDIEDILFVITYSARSPEWPA